MLFMRRFGVLIIGAALVAAGVLGSMIYVPETTFGWTAYAPTTNVTFTPVPNVFWLFDASVAVGLVLIAGWVGYRLGSRRRS